MGEAQGQSAILSPGLGPAASGILGNGKGISGLYPSQNALAVWHEACVSLFKVARSRIGKPHQHVFGVDLGEDSSGSR